MLWRRPHRIALLLTLSLSATAASAANRCKLVMTPPIPVKMENLRPVISANIDGTEARFLIDTGSFFDFLSPAAAAEFKLPLRYAPPWYYVTGIGGSFVPRIATAKTLEVAGMTGREAEFLVGDNDFQGGVAGILGQNILRITDIDYDFADGVLRFVKPQHCGDNVLAYWATTQPIGVVNLRWTSEQRPNMTAKASVNGHEIEVVFDTGSSRTVLSLEAAKRAGITPDSPGVVPAGEWLGLGHKTIKVWAIPIETFEIGGETIEHTHVLMGDLGMPALDADMLLGSDFFLAHHIYVAYSQDKLYFTYNGGTVFDLNARPPVQAKNSDGKGPAPADSPPTGTQPAALPGAGGSTTPPEPSSDTPADAAAFMRRGMAETSRHQYPQAIADLSRACDLKPADADCRYQRGLAYWYGSQPESALTEFTAAIKLRPDDFDAYLARAQLEMAGRPADAESDLDAADRLAPPQADLRMELARLYAVAGEYAGAVHQYDLWIEYHPQDVRLQFALSGRCGSEAAANVDVDRALDDCNTALRLIRRSDNTQTLVSAMAMSNRGLVHLRQGQLDDARTDLESALNLAPKLAGARYELGLVELKKGLKAQGEADLAAASAARPGLAKRLASIGLKP